MKTLITILIICIFSVSLKSKERSNYPAPVGSASEFVLDFYKNISKFTYIEAKSKYAQQDRNEFTKSEYQQLIKMNIQVDKYSTYKETPLEKGIIKVEVVYFFDNGKTKGAMVDDSNYVKKINQKWMFIKLKEKGTD